MLQVNTGGGFTFHSYHRHLSSFMILYKIIYNKISPHLTTIAISRMVVRKMTGVRMVLPDILVKKYTQKDPV